MKTIDIKLFIAGALLLLMPSCSEDKLSLYEDVDRVFFAWAAPDLGSARNENSGKVDLGYDNPVKSDSIIKIKVRLMGKISAIDRPVTAELVQTESTAIYGEDIEFLPSVMPADSVNGYLLVKVKNSDKLTKLTLLARIHLTPNEYFHTDMDAFKTRYEIMNGLEFNLRFDSKTEIPNLWADSPDIVRYFGTWSRVKEAMIYDVLGLTRDFFMYNPSTEDAITVTRSRITSELALGMCSSINRYLEAYKKTHNGETLKDENGNDVKIGVSFF